MKPTLVHQQYEDMIKNNYALEQEVARLKELNREMVGMLKNITDQIERAHKGSIGSIDNVYLPQVGIKTVGKLKAVLAKAEGVQGNE